MSPAQLSRRLRRLFAGRGTGGDGFREVLRSQARAFDRAFGLVGVFYACNVFVVFLHAQRWPGMLQSAEIDPLWPVFWVEAVGIRNAVHAIMALLLVGAAAAALLPHRRPARLAAFLGLLFFHAFGNSFGKINHPWHGWLLAALLLVFLPDGSRAALSASRAARQRYLNAFWSAQAMQLVFYTMAGFHKITGVVPQLLRGEVHSFAPAALSYHVAHRLVQTRSESLLGDLVIEFPLLGWLPFLFTMYLQAFAVWIAFRPSLQRPWALGLVAFHFFTYLAMDVSFGPSTLLLGIFFLCSPFAPLELDWRRALRDLPILGLPLRRLPGPAPEPG